MKFMCLISSKTFPICFNLLKIFVEIIVCDLGKNIELQRIYTNNLVHQITNLLFGNQFENKKQQNNYMCFVQKNDTMIHEKKTPNSLVSKQRTFDHESHPLLLYSFPLFFLTWYVCLEWTSWNFQSRCISLQQPKCNETRERINE